MLRNTLLASVAVFALAGAAFAADLPTTKGPAVYTPPPMAYSWTGAYIGGQAGYEWGRTNSSLYSPAGAFLAAFPTYTDPGFIGGGHIGYNYQIDQFVLGVEGDINGSTQQGNTALGRITYASTRIPIQGDLLGRVGYAWDRALLFATGGLAIGDIHNAYEGAGFGVRLPAINSQFWNWRAGWAAGGGLEYAIDPNWSVEAEYLYTDYGAFTEAPIRITALTSDSARVHIRDQQVMLGVSYKFDWAQPVVSKY